MSNHFWNPVADAPVIVQHEKTSTPKPKQEMEETHFDKRRNYIHQYNRVKEKQYSISFIFIRKTFAHQLPEMYVSRNFIEFFLQFAGQKHNFFQSVPPTTGVQ